MSAKQQKHLGVSWHGKTAEFRVWAPFAKNVQLLLGTELDWQEHKMSPTGDGYWALRTKKAEIGQKYQYKITAQNGDELIRNDPRSRQLTDSDNGASIVVGELDVERPPNPVIPTEKTVIYELHIGTFHRPDPATPGTFYDAIKKLDYLVDLGINCIELMPIASMESGNGWGYAPAHIFSVEASYGGRHGLAEFIRECHLRNITVILDVVYNHISPTTNPLWQYDGWSENDRGGIYFYNDERGDTPWGARFDYSRPEVRHFILDNIAMWLSEYRLDGFRVDSTIYMRNMDGNNDNPDRDLPDAWTLMSDINDVAHHINPNALVIAEDMSLNAYMTKPKDAGGCGFDAQWQLDFAHAIRDALGLHYGSPQNISFLRREIEKQYNGNVFEKVIFSDSHDTAANGQARLNEQAGNTSASDILAREHLLLANTITLTSPGIPMLLQGQEFLQQGTFNDWKELEWQKAETYSGMVLAHKHLIDLRLNRYDNTAGLSGQSTSIFHEDDTNNVIAYHRWQKGGAGDDTIIIANFGSTTFEDYDVQLPIAGTWVVRFNSSWKGYSPDFHEQQVERIKTSKQGRASIPLAPYGALILSQDKE